VEAKQVRDDSEYSVRCADANTAPQTGRARINGAPVAWPRSLARAFRRRFVKWLRIGWLLVASLRVVSEFVGGARAT